MRLIAGGVANCNYDLVDVALHVINSRLRKLLLARQESRSNCADSAVLWSLIRSRHAHAYVSSSFGPGMCRSPVADLKRSRSRSFECKLGQFRGHMSAKWGRTGTLPLLESLYVTIG